jgi:hypothetical protein
MSEAAAHLEERHMNRCLLALPLLVVLLTGAAWAAARVNGTRVYVNGVPLREQAILRVSSGLGTRPEGSRPGLTSMGQGATAGVSETMARRRVVEASGGVEEGREDAVRRAELRGDAGGDQYRKSGGEPVGGDLGVGEDAALDIARQCLG